MRDAADHDKAGLLVGTDRVDDDLEAGGMRKRVWEEVAHVDARTRSSAVVNADVHCH